MQSREQVRLRLLNLDTIGKIKRAAGVYAKTEFYEVAELGLRFETSK